jgi:hypothetical protein
MNTEVSTEIIDHVPLIGEKIIVIDIKGNHHLATVISQWRCYQLEPIYWHASSDTPRYTIEEMEESPNTNTRCFQYDNGPVDGHSTGICCMRFRKMSGGYEFNKNVRKVS